MWQQSDGGRLCLYSNSGVAGHVQRPDQPVSDRLQEHPDHHQHGGSERRRRRSEEETRRRRRLRRSMTAAGLRRRLWFLEAEPGQLLLAFSIN